MSGREWNRKAFVESGLSQGDDLRPFLKEPFDAGGWTVGTNGHIACAVEGEGATRTAPPPARVPAAMANYLNDAHPEILVTTTDDLKAFAVAPPPLADPKEQECSSCRGSGDCECACCGIHECAECDGAGVLRGDDPAPPVDHGAIVGRRINRHLLHRIVRYLPDGDRVTIRAPNDTWRSLRLEGPDWRALLMPMRPLDDATVPSLEVGQPYLSAPTARGDDG